MVLTLEGVVVICLKFTTFVVATTVSPWLENKQSCCDLLKIYYLCGSNNSYKKKKHHYSVVICLKFTTFVVATTVITIYLYFLRML